MNLSILPESSYLMNLKQNYRRQANSRGGLVMVAKEELTKQLQAEATTKTEEMSVSMSIKTEATTKAAVPRNLASTSLESCSAD